jgi:hypothetical protein
MLFRIFPGQQLEEDDVSAADKTRWPTFAKWQWTPDTTAMLENQDIKVTRCLLAEAAVTHAAVLLK